MRISDFCFLSAVLAALCGMSLGIHMGLAQDFTLAPAHAHLNLLGWVTMGLFGLYHRGIEGGRLGWIQAGVGAYGFWAMPIGLAAHLSGDDRLEMLVVTGSLAALSSMALFGAVVVREVMRRRAGPQTAASVSAA